MADTSGSSESDLIPFSRFVESALYDSERGFYATGGQAGRRGDFVTNPEVGPLFGAVLARALDHWWDELDRPDPFWVIDAGAGPGTLARTLTLAEPRCASAWRYVAVERSAVQHRQHPDWVESRVDLPSGPRTGVVVANELLDNLPFDLVYEGDPVLVADNSAGPRLVPDVDLDRCQPDCTHARVWLADALALLDRGRVVAIDYTAPVGRSGWLRTYRGHQRGRHPLEDVGAQDITTDVPIEQLAAVRRPSVVTSQAEWLRRWGIDELVDEGRRVWQEQAGTADLHALRARSRVSESDALLDADGLGGFTVLEWIIDGR